MEQINGAPIELDIGVYSRKHPVPCKERSAYVDTVNTAHIIQLTVFFGFALTITSTIRFQVWEKESHNFKVSYFSMYSNSLCQSWFFGLS